MTDPRQTTAIESGTVLIAPQAGILYYPDTDEVGIWMKCSQPGEYTLHHPLYGFFLVATSTERS